MYFSKLHLEGQLFSNWHFPGCPHAALIAKIATVPGDVFCVGNFFTTTTVTDGMIEFRINDTRLDDNIGRLAIKIEIY
jgi:hypothetical protein